MLVVGRDTVCGIQGVVTRRERRRPEIPSSLARTGARGQGYYIGWECIDRPVVPFDKDRNGKVLLVCYGSKSERFGEELINGFIDGVPGWARKSSRRRGRGIYAVFGSGDPKVRLG